MEPRDDADDMSPSTVERPRRRGLGFFPEPVVIKSDPYPGGSASGDTHNYPGGSASGDTHNCSDSGLQFAPAAPSAPYRVPQSYSSWDEWKAWNSGHASTLSHKPPPVFVRPDIVKTGFEQGEEEGFGVHIENDAAHDAQSDAKITSIDGTAGTGKMPGSDLANWYRNLATKATNTASTAKQSVPTEEVQMNGDLGAPDLSAPASSVNHFSESDLGAKPDTNISHSTSPAPRSSSSLQGVSAEKPSQPSVTTSSAATSQSSTSIAVVASTAPVAPASPAPLRVPASEWFIRRALAKKHAAGSPAPSPPPKRPSSISGMLNLDAATKRPPPQPRYAIGADNVGYARLSSMGWGGGGLGRPIDSPTSSRPRTRTATPEGSGRSRSRSPVPRSSLERGPLPTDLADLADLEDEEERPSGPGRTEPVATALKLDRRGLGSGHVDKKVTHTHAEIRRAQRRSGRPTGEPKQPVKNKPKIKWAQQEKKEREERKRLLAALNA